MSSMRRCVRAKGSDVVSFGDLKDLLARLGWTKNTHMHFASGVLWQDPGAGANGAQFLMGYRDADKLLSTGRNDVEWVLSCPPEELPLMLADDDPWDVASLATWLAQARLDGRLEIL